MATVAVSIGAVALTLGLLLALDTQHHNNSSPSPSSSSTNKNNATATNNTTLLPSSLESASPSSTPFMSSSMSNVPTKLVTSNAPIIEEGIIVAVCPITGTDALGPFYTPNPPSLEDINGQLSPPNEPGVPIHITGRLRRSNTILNEECGDALGNWTVDLWQADAEGTYDNSGGYHLRGTVKTNETGYYEFRSVLPGRYVPRPRHVHFRIWSASSTFQGGDDELVSQMYFGDDEAEIASLEMSYPGRVVVLDSDGSGQFDIHLAS